MTTEQLEKRVRVERLGSGEFRFTTKYHGKDISVTSNESVIYYIIISKEPMLGITYRQALQHAHARAVDAHIQWNIFRDQSKSNMVPVFG